jgi:ABC-2 type transport system permease protein
MAQSTGLWAISAREVNRIRSRLICLLVILILPVTTFLIFIAMFIHGVPRDLPVAVMDGDNTALSRKLVRMIDELPSIQVKYRATSLEEGKRLMLQGNIFACVVIPRNFEHDVYRQLAPKVYNYYNNQYLLVGGTINKDIYTAVRTLSVGVNISTRLKKGEMLAQAKVNAQPVELQAHILFNPYTNYMYYLVSSLLPNMLHIFILFSAIYCIGIELKEKTAGSLMEMAGGSVVKALAGKFIPYFAIFSLLGLFMNSLLFGYLGVPLKGSFPVLMLGTILMILAYQAVGVVFVTVVANLRMALMGASFYASTAYTFIGMTFPIIAFPLPARIWAECLPLTHFMRIFIDQGIMGSPVRMSVPSCAALVAFIVLPFVFGSRFKTIMSNDAYWGKL